MSQVQNQETYSTSQVCQMVGLSAPRVHQMRNGQKVRAKNGRVYDIKPTLEEGKHWGWADSDVVFYPAGIEAIINRRTKAPKKVTSDNGEPKVPAKRGRKPKVAAEPQVQEAAPAQETVEV